MTPITTAGTYAAGDYYLSNNIDVSGTDGITIASGKLDLAGFRIRNTSPGNSWTYGIQSTSALTVFDSVGTGSVTGFRVGAKLSGTGCRVISGDWSGNTYIGIWLPDNNASVLGSLIGSIGGVTDEPYAIGIQCVGDSPVIDGVVFKNLYRQSGYTGTNAGEGLPVNFAAGCTNGVLKNWLAYNDEFKQDTIGVFAGSGGGHSISNGKLHNFFKPAQLAQVGPGSSVDGVICSYSKSLPASSGTGTVLDKSLTGMFGNVDGKTSRVRLKASQMAVPSGSVTKIRLTLQAHADEPFVVSKCYLGKKAASGDPCDASSLNQLFVSGSSSFTIPAGYQSVTDWLTFSWNKTDDLILSFYSNGGTTADKLAAVSSSANGDTYLKAGDEAAVADVTGFSEYLGYLSLVTKIETDGF